MDSPGIATSRMHVSVILTVSGAILLMAGISLTVIGEAMRLQDPAGWPQLIIPGVVLAGGGLGLGAAAAFVTAAGLGEDGVRDRPSGPPHEAAGAADQAGPAGARGAGASGAQAGGAGGATGSGWACADPWPAGAQYADDGWHLAGQPEELTREIHHPVRPMPAPAGTGRHCARDAGQVPAPPASGSDHEITAGSG